jgi:hypothetical protein
MSKVSIKKSWRKDMDSQWRKLQVPMEHETEEPS